MSHLLLHKLVATSDVQEGLTSRLRPHGFTVDDKLRAWRPARISPVAPGVSYTDGYKFQRVPLHHGTTGLTALTHRFFFVGDKMEPTSVALSDLPEPCARLTPMPPSRRIAACTALLAECGTDPQLCSSAPLPTEVETYVGGDFTLRVGQPLRCGERDAAVRAGRMKPEWIHRAPSRTRWLVVSRVLSASAIAAYTEALKSGLKWAGHVSINVVPLDCPPSDAQLIALATDSCIVLVGVNGAKGTALDSSTTTLLAALDSARTPYRLFADASRSNRFALRDQISHLVSLAGGLDANLC